MAIVIKGKGGMWVLRPGDILVFKFSSNTNVAGVVDSVHNDKVKVTVGTGKGAAQFRVKKKSIVSAEQCMENRKYDESQKSQV